jgi:flagellar motility protein MotE (MotC chaperone)
MSSPSSEKAIEAKIPDRPEELPITTPQRRSKPLGTIFSIATLILVVLLLKLGLTMGSVIWKGTDSYLPTFPKEVLAEERKPKAREAAAQKPDPPASSASSTIPRTAASMTEMVTHLEQKEAELKKREEQIRQKEEYLTKLEQETEKRLKELIAIQKEIQAYRAEKEETQNGKIRSLAKIYGTMKPKEAAKLLENLDEQLVVSVISTMTADEAGNILGNMDIKKAAKISESLSHR